jgi:hypothetical protein
MSSTRGPGGGRRVIRRNHVQAQKSGATDRRAPALTASRKLLAPSVRTPVDPPLFCDFSCPHAAFPPVDVMGACRREAGIYCSLLKRYNNKNAACLVIKSRA